ncbi:hypothetical protein GUA87_15435, partial [Sneathiella sp. P13V-1]|uniref:hypothetical protein n=1 Tax=Sneathiella sp. P13V-1 TaxID=2697366 RepID=UPI00187B30B2
MASDSNKQLITVSNSNSTVSVEAGAIVQLPYSGAEEVIFTQNAGNLVITPLGGDNQIVLENFFVREEGDAGSSIQFSENGTLLSVEEIIANLENFDPAAIAPAAGGAGGGDGGGASFDPYADDGIGDGIGIEDLLPPTDLEFTEPEELEERSGDTPDGTITVTFISDDPEGELGPIEGGYEDWQPYQNEGSSYTVPMQMVVEFTPDDNEVLNFITISNIPEGAKIFIGGTGAANEGTIIDGEITILAPGGVLPDLFLLPPADSDNDITLNIQADITDPEGGDGVISGSGTAIIDAAADRPDLDVDGNFMYGDDIESDFSQEERLIQYPEMNISCTPEDTNISFDINVQFGDNVDGSETHVVTATVPAGWTVVDSQGGVWTPGGDGTGGTLTYDVAVGVGETGALNVSPVLSAPEDYSGSETVTVTATASETASDEELSLSNNQAVVQENIDLNITVVADTPVIELTGTTTVDLQSGVYLVKEDNSVDIGFKASTGEYAKSGEDADGSENLTSVVITGLKGWDVNTTELNGNPDIDTIDFNGATLTITFVDGVETFSTSSISVTPPEDSDYDLSQLGVAVYVEDTGVNCFGDTHIDTNSSSTTSSIIVDAVLDEYADVESSTLANITEGEAVQEVSLGLSATLADAGFAQSLD